MGDHESKETKKGLSDRIRGGLEGSLRSFSRIEAEGENLVRGLVEESAKRVIEHLNMPTKEDLDSYNKNLKAFIDENVISRLEKSKVPSRRDFEPMARQLSATLEEQVRKGLARLNLAARKDVETVAADLKKLRKTVDKLTTTAATAESKASPKKPASKKKAPAAKACPKGT